MADRGRLGLAAAIALAIAAFYGFGVDDWLSFEKIRSQQAALSAFATERPAGAIGAYFVAYVAITALSLPGAALMTLLGGAIFGLGAGTLIVSFAATLGATLAFLAARFVFREPLQRRFGERLAAIDRGVACDGAFYLLTLRLIPLVPFFLVNLLVGLTALPVRTYWWVSQLGMLPGTIVYVNVGRQLGQLESPAGLLSPALIASFAALAALPLFARRGVDLYRARRAGRRWSRPARFDRNLIVIGAGSAGLVCAYIAASLKASVTLVERHRMGGDCLNSGCVPSKALIRTAKLLHEASRAADYGVRGMRADFEFGEIMARVQRVIRRIEPHDSVERYRGLGVDCRVGDATLISPWQVEIRAGDGSLQTLSARSIVVATGAQPIVPSIPGIEAVGCLTSDTVWSLREAPGRLLVLGGGPLGCELAQAFARIGVPVTLVEMAPRLMNREDEEVSGFVADTLRGEGVDLRLGLRARRFEVRGGRKLLVAEVAEVAEVVEVVDAGAGPGGIVGNDCKGSGNPEVEIAFDTLLCALGRRAATEGLGLEALGIPLSAAGTIEVDETLRTAQPNIFACGDVASPWQFTHAAAQMAWHAAVNALFGGLRRFRVDWSAMPSCTFVDPEVARVGLNESQARERGIAFELTRYELAGLDRAITDEVARGFVKVLTAPGSDRILGATIVGERAGETIAEFVTAMKRGIGLNRILGTIHVYPTMTEANKNVAGAWKRAHAPQRLLRWLGRWHAWKLNR